MNGEKLTIFYDGSCSVCSKEMTYYREHDQSSALEFVDITARHFKAHLYERTQDEFMARLHVREADGVYYTGVDAFAAIWRRMPGWHFDLLATMVQLPGIHLLASVGYKAFARVRPWLPKRAGGCDDESCRWGHPHSRH